MDKKGKSEKYSYRILSEMTYEEYVTLIKIDEKNRNQNQIHGV